MDFLSDLLLAAGAMGAAVYCLVLSRRLRALTSLDSGMGSAIAVLSAQVDGLSRALDQARAAAQDGAQRLQAQSDRAEAAGRRLELLIAALHDLPEPGPGPRSGDAGPDRIDPAGYDLGADGPVRGGRILRRRSAERAA